MPEKKLNVMISSTVRDLPEHRKELMDACLRQGMFPTMMEHLPASDAEAIGASLQMVDEADAYLGVFAHRYGYVPSGHDISVTEMEYNRAVERKIPRLIFVMGEDHPIKAKDMEQGEGAVKLQGFKDRIGKENIVNFFDSPADLRAHVINGLSQSKLRQPDLTAFHYVSDIPAPPESYIAHPYTLLQTHRLVGRQAELNLLTDWVAKPSSEVYAARIFNIVAIGGMGKSALTWKWFNEIAPQEMKPLAGRMWWSFYESDASFENFVTRALAYTTRRPLTEVEQIPAPEREAQLLAALDREPFLIVLDGPERMLIAYARMDAAHLDALGAQPLGARASSLATEPQARAHDSSQIASEDARDPRASKDARPPMRKTADPRAGNFLRKLAMVRGSRILVSTRLYPADLENKVNGDPLPGCFGHELRGLAEDDALELWRAFGATGSRDQLLPVFHRVETHPLLIQSLAAEVARFRRAPGDFDAWRQAHPDFNPFQDLSLVQVKSHVLEFALRSLGEQARQVLWTIAAFRMPASYDTLVALLVAKVRRSKYKPVVGEQGLDAILTELEDRGLVGWDKRANRYDLHPIVRGVVWSGLGDEAQHTVYTKLCAHFEAVPMIDDFLKVSRLEDLTPAIELYNTLIGLGRFDDAGTLFIERLSYATYFRLSANRQRIGLLEMLFPDGLDQSPFLCDLGVQAYILSTLSAACHFTGQPIRAAKHLGNAITIYSEIEHHENLGISLGNLSHIYRLSGALYESEAAARRALATFSEQAERQNIAACLSNLGLTLAAQGKVSESEFNLRRSLEIYIECSDHQSACIDNIYLAQRCLWLGEFAVALLLANHAWKLAQVQNLECDVISASRVQGAAALGLHDFAVADERLHHALTRARQVNLVEEELPALIALAELRRREGKRGEARELLDDVWEGAERGPYPLFHADALNVLAQLERDAGNAEKAIEAATQAYRLAWCDGPPYAYHWGLEAARKHLRELGAPEPVMPPFDPAKFEPMPEVEIDPEDEFHVGLTKDDGVENI